MSIDTLVSRSDFAGAFKAVKPHVIPKTERFLDVLRNVEIRFFEDHLTMTATNRYTLAEARVNYLGENRLPSETGETAILVNVDDLAYAVKRPNVVSQLSVQVKENALVLDYTTEAPLDTDSSFPKLSHLWPAEGTEVEVSSISIDPKYLAMFDSRNLARSKSETSHVGLKLTFRGQSKPVALSFSDHFRGLVMPVRTS